MRRAFVPLAILLALTARTAIAQELLPPAAPIPPPPPQPPPPPAPPPPQFGPVRTYAFAGAILVGAPSDLSSTEVNVGGLGGFGFEFLIGRYSSYFVELGALGTGATADKLVDSPIFANGFLITVGSRFYP